MKKYILMWFTMVVLINKRIEVAGSYFSSLLGFYMVN